MIDELDAFEALKRSSVSQLLMKAGRLANERALERTPEESWPRLRPSHTALFPHLDFEGTRLGVLAERLGVSKQAVSQLVSELEAMAVLRRIPDPSDARAKLVVFAEHGPRLLTRGMALLQALDADLEAELGARRYTELRRTLVKVVEALAPTAAATDRDETR